MADPILGRQCEARRPRFTEPGCDGRGLGDRFSQRRRRPLFRPMDAKSPTMIRALLLALLSLLIVCSSAVAHVGSPDLFFNGSVGPYPAHVTIRMPRVVPGRAEISVRLETEDHVEVSFLPLYGRTEVKNAPPPDRGRLVKGEKNLYTGELWLMSFGAYSVEVRIAGAKGDGAVQIPLTSVATRQLPMPSVLGKVLSLL